MDWDMIKAATVICSILGVVLIAAAKSIFASKTDCEKMQNKIESEIVVLKSNLYGEQGIPVYVTRREWDSSKDKRAQQAERAQQHICNKIDKLTDALERLRDSQEKTNITISRLQVRRTGDEELKEIV